MRKACLLVLFFAFSLSHQVKGQSGYSNDNPPISLADSLKLQGFLDSLNHSSLFSVRYQRYFDSALAIKPWKAYWWQQKAMPLLKTQKYELGMISVDSAVNYDTKNHHYLEYRAFVKCIFQKDYIGAIKDFDLLLNYHGNRIVMDHPYNFYKALCYLQLNNLDSCEYLLTSGINERRKERGSETVHYLDWFYSGIVRFEREDYTGALTYLDSSLKIYKQFSDAHYYKATCYSLLHQPKRALECINTACTFHNDGYTINEDNAEWERYPYQVRNKAFASSQKYLQQVVAKAEQ